MLPDRSTVQPRTENGLPFDGFALVAIHAASGMMVFSRVRCGLRATALAGATISGLPDSQEGHGVASVVAEPLSACRGEPEEAP
jgi:hypothetical protein